jgi:hypothetical protein
MRPASYPESPCCCGALKGCQYAGKDGGTHGVRANRTSCWIPARQVGEAAQSLASDSREADTARAGPQGHMAREGRRDRGGWSRRAVESRENGATGERAEVEVVRVALKVGSGVGLILKCLLILL